MTAGNLGRASASKVGLREGSRGVAIVIEASHGGMASRGVRQHGVSMVTKCWLGDFRDDAVLRRELMKSLPRQFEGSR